MRITFDICQNYVCRPKHFNYNLMPRFKDDNTQRLPEYIAHIFVKYCKAAT
jgi:hypothetical protein